MTRAVDLVGLGEGMVEFWADEPLGTATTFRRAYGGDVLNALVTAARLGARTRFVTQVGNDPFGHALLAAWQAEGVDTRFAPLVPGDNGVYYIGLDDRGDREFTYRRAGSAASRLAPHHLGIQSLRDARVLLLSGVTQAISASAQAATLHAAVTAQSAGVTVAYDPNYRAALWAPRGGPAAARAAMAEVLRFVDVLLPSFPADFAPLGGAHRHLDDDLDRCGRLLPDGAVIAVKAAEGGAYLRQHGTTVHVPAPPAPVVDSTGAGDAWNGAFLFARLGGADDVTAARLAHQAARWVLAHRGAIPPHPPTVQQETA